MFDVDDHNLDDPPTSDDAQPQLEAYIRGKDKLEIQNPERANAWIVTDSPMEVQE